MRKAWLSARSAVLWAVSGVHFAVVCSFLVLLGIFVDPARNDWPQRVFFRNILRLAGARFAVHRAPGFDPARISLFVCNHVNLFDPFVIYSAIPQFVRGFELESHFKIPVYGWMMGRFGNVPVPDKPTREGLARMNRLAKEAFDRGTSLIAFAEASRTRDGRVQPFKSGVFRLAVKLGTPVVPMSITGSYEFFRTGHWMLRPGRIIVYLHGAIETRGLQLADVDALRNRVHAIVAAPVEASLRKIHAEGERSISMKKEGEPEEGN